MMFVKFFNVFGGKTLLARAHPFNRKETELSTEREAEQNVTMKK
jgi:hypothetical protein